MPSEPTSRPPKPPGLGPHCVGQRVVVRRVLREETGPSGGPAFTDLLGVMLSWEPPTTVVEADSGERVRIALADIVSGKPVPPRPSVRLRVTVEEAERRALRGWPAIETRELGAWVLRASGGFSARANSVLALGSPGMPLDDALLEVAEFYGARGLPAWAQVMLGSDLEAELVARGWDTARAGEPDTSFFIASVARASRALRARALPTGVEVSVSPAASDEWLANDDRALAHGAVARAVLEGPEEVAFVSFGSPALAKGRVSLADDWAGITDLWVSPELRGRGHSFDVVKVLLGWAAERGATTAYLQAHDDNAPALALYERLGFVPHHTYRYLAAP